MRQPLFAGQPETDGKATGSLILGILSLLCFSFLAGIPAVVLGHMSRKSIAESMGRLKGDGMALAGLIMGYISIASIPIVLIIAAIAIPNLLRAKLAANEAGAKAVIRTVNTAQVSYSTSYPARGYARELAALGPGPSNQCGEASDTYACLIDGPLANAGIRNGYRYSMTAVCGTDSICTDYVVVSTPVTPGSTGTRSFCSTGDAVVRSYRGTPASLPATVEECQEWLPI
jgi:type IV pilus assembly protein PilA